ncbi:hypothetical protein ATEIFO6365_0005046100 [Aspergillus terreus]|uniref:Uncharacterized protein n=1 Tax=Aspergillus terreus TaxID=33178 RepID=A0A5M3Z541_ASPTE|nr:hypothetical protein ATETN484_0007046600 [Aspergillus terreus]GFF16271.1 hypothetical protein ATEIFO6365_0005046100 [Aspergillus terreus]
MAPALLPSSPALAQSSTSRLPQTSVQDGGSYDSQMQNPSFLAGMQVINDKMELQKQLERQEVAFEEVMKINNKEREAHSRTKEEVQSLKNEIKEKNKAFDKQTEQVKSLQSQAASLQSKYEDERHKVADAHGEIGGLFQKIASKDTQIDELKSAGSRWKEKYAVSTNKIKELEAKNSDLDQRLKAATDRVRELEGFATGLHDLDENQLIDGYAMLWEYARNEVYSQLEADLDSKVLRDSAAWEELRHCDLAIQHRIPLPSSNSLAAKQMRFAMILAMLAREIDKYIFQPAYIAGEDCPSRQLLANLAAVNTEKEAFCRSMLFSLDPESQSKRCQWRVQKIVQHVSSYLCALLSDEQHSQFCQSLENVANKAVEVWHFIQHARRKYESGFEPADSDDETAAFVFPGLESVDTPSNSQSPAQSSLIIFPHIYAIEGNKKILYTPTWQLTSMHPQWVAAEQELRQGPPSSAFERVVSTQLRKFMGRRSSSSH